MAEHRPPNYSGKCRNIDIARSKAPARLRERPAPSGCASPSVPSRFHDIVHGDVEFSNEVVSDPIILRSSGMPVYNYVVVIDDALMKITHVIRGDDHLSNTPKQVALYEALGWPVPEFAHLSTILGSDRERLSKRHGATSIANFRDMGVLPEALVNYLALLGWAPTGGTREIFSPARVDQGIFAGARHALPRRLRHGEAYWLNRHYLKGKSPGDIYNACVGYLFRAGALSQRRRSRAAACCCPPGFREWFLKVIELLAPSVDRLEQFPDRAGLIFRYDAKAALAAPDNAEVLGWKNTEAVFTRFTVKIMEDESSENRTAHARMFQAVGERSESGNRREGQRTLPPHPPDHHRITLRPGIRQTDSHPRRRQPPRSAPPRAERARARRSLRPGPQVKSNCARHGPYW